MIVRRLESILGECTNKLGYDKVRVIVSNRPDLCDYQCDDVFRLAKMYQKTPQEIGEAIVSEIIALPNFNNYFSKVEFVLPGFINLTLSDQFIVEVLTNMTLENHFGISFPNQKELFFLDYGGPNIAKPLHVGHMRTAIVGESIKRIIRYMGHDTISDVHLGDYGLQIGQVIYGIINDKVAYEDIDIQYLDKIYPKMSALCKEDEKIKEQCATITKELQDGNLEYQKLWKKILDISSADIKSIYDYLSVHFDLWLGESDAYPYLPKTEAILKDKGLIEVSEGAEVVSVTRLEDKKELPPLLFKKANGAYLYASTDLATIVDRMEHYHPDHILYITDSRQSLHFEQVFRVCELAGITTYASLEHLGYGTVNGLDGKPYKTRSGDTPKLQYLFEQAKEVLISKKESNQDMAEEDINKIVNAILKFADLQNNRERDYIFDISKFSDVIGKTGPYILYTYLRINKIINNESVGDITISNKIYNDYDRNLRLEMLKMPIAVTNAFAYRMPHYIAEYVYNLCVVLNAFYQNNHIHGLEDLDKKASWITVIKKANQMIKELLFLLVIEIPKAM